MAKQLRHIAARTLPPSPPPLALALLLLGALLATTSACTTQVIQVRDHDPLFDDDGDRDGKQRLRRNISPPQPPGPPPIAEVDPAERPDVWRHGADTSTELSAILDDAEQLASPLGRKVLQTGRAMVDQGQVVVGSCWTFVTAVYTQAGFSARQRTRVHRGKKAGPYVDPDEFQPGDHLSYVNHSYNGSEHSAIFVRWLDRERVEALMLSYVGSNRQVPGGYRSYLLTHVYTVIRPKP